MSKLLFLSLLACATAVFAQEEAINKKTAEKIQREEEERLAKPKDSYRIVPYWETEKLPTLKKKLKNGTKIYATKPSPQKYSGGFTIGPYAPTSLSGDVAGVTYESIYGNSRPIMVTVSGEWQFLKSAGKLGLQGSVGIFTTQGSGLFLHNIGGTPSDTIITLIAVPIGVTALYHLQLWDTQPLVPFAGVGFDYFGMFESRDDRDDLARKIRYGGAPAWHWTAGLQLQLDFIDKEVVWQMDHDYGINHVYLTADVKQVVGLSSVHDFSSLVYEGGFLFEF